jgi:DHA2 family multidrug resistance protein-like MFS transporter
MTVDWRAVEHPPDSLTPTVAAPTAAAGHPQRWLILAILCACVVLIVASVSSLNIAIPPIQKALGATQTQIQWIVDAYALVFAGLLLPAGALGDRFGRKWTLLGGLVVLATASTIAATVNSPSHLIAMRAIMGIGAAFIMPSTLSLITSVFPAHERPKAIAVWAGFAGAGGAVGVVASGLLLEKFWWGSVFLIAGPIAVFAAVAIALIVPNSKDPSGHPLDPLGSLFSIIGFSSLVFAIIEGPSRGWSDALVVGGFVASVVGLVLFVSWELRVEHPMLDPRYFRIKRFRIGASVITIAFFGMFGMFFVVSQYLQFVKGYSPLKTGLATLPSALTMVIVAPRAVLIQQRITVRRTIALGLALITIGMAVFAIFLRDDSSYLIPLIAILFMASGAGCAMPSSTTSIMSSLPMNKAGVGSAVNDTTREVGGALGIAVVGSVLASVYRSNFHAADALAEPARSMARDNIGAATSVGKTQFASDPAAMQAFLHDAGHAFTKGLNLGLGIAATMSLLMAFVVLRVYPRDTELGRQAEMPERG